MAGMLDDLGWDSAAAFRACGIDGESLMMTGTVSAADHLAFDRHFACLTAGRHDLWFELGRRHRVPSYGDLGMALLTAPTLRHFVRLSSVSRSISSSLADFAPIASGASVVGIEMRVDNVPQDLRTFTMIRDIGAAVTCLDDIWRGAFPVACIEMPSEVGDVLPLIRPRPCQLTDELAVVRFLWREEVAEQPLFNGCQDLHDFYVYRCVEHGEIRSPAREIRRRLGENPNAPLSLPDVASGLNLSVRTLQRRLQEDGVTFRTLVQNIKMQIAKEHLQEPNASIDAVAMKLGYADRSSFDLAFRRWMGTSPSRFRRQALASFARGMPLRPDYGTGP